MTKIGVNHLLSLQLVHVTFFDKFAMLFNFVEPEVEINHNCLDGLLKLILQIAITLPLKVFFFEIYMHFTIRNTLKPTRYYNDSIIGNKGFAVHCLH